MFKNSITEYFKKKTYLLNVQPEITLSPPGFSMFNTGGVEVEVAEFLYSFTKLVKPGFVLETGTHLGISSSYIAQACKENNKGSLWTYEVISELQQQAKELWSDLGLTNFINSLLQPSLDAEIPSTFNIDLLFLDSEPQYRFDEFLKFWNLVTPGGFIIIHDLDGSLGHHGQTHHGVYNWPYGDYRIKIGKFIENNEVQIFSFPTPRGLVVFQKQSKSFEYSNSI